MKSTIKLISASALALLTLSTSVPAFAATTPAAAPAPAKTTGKISLTADPDATHPGDGDDGNDGNNPTDPNNPDTPGEGNDNTGQNGPFTLDVVPNYNFGTHTVENQEKTYYALYTSNATTNKGKGVLDDKRLANPYVQVTDLREENSGWNVTAQITDFKTTAGKVLTGAVLTMPTGTTHLAGDKDDATTNPKPTTKSIALNGTSQAFMSAEKSAGIGTWMDYMFENNNTAVDDATDKNATSLYIPQGNSAGDYSADLTWTLSDAPQA